jgi:hypothetical protein|tara:strand:+ start:276 stop:458 length:183 start_codon:yes stop_codon:yes gene_type:complete
MAVFTSDTLAEKNNTLLVITVFIILMFAIFVLLSRDDLNGILISLALIITCAVIVVVQMD